MALSLCIRWVRWYVRGGGCRELKESAGVQPRVWPVSVCKSMSLDRGRSTAWDPCWIRFCGEAGATIFMVFPENDAAERCRGCWVGLQIGTCLSASCSPYQQPRALQLVLAFWRSNCCPSLAAIRSSLPPSLSHPLSMPLSLSSSAILLNQTDVPLLQGP